MPLLLAEITSTEWGLLIGFVLTAGVPSLASWIVVIVKLNRLEQGQEFYKQTQDSISADQRSMWTQIGKHEERLDLHDGLIGKLLDKLEISIPKQR